ncbi:UbiA family prenyltransferase [Nocardioides sp.]|uniref:UbiA family prenyltransferase n=1 Tax=Nocardioides sp. TaxID=35761 RepID=UPI002ED43C19
MASTSSDGPAVDGDTRRSWRHWTPLLLLRASHPRLGLISALGLAGAAALSGRPTREVGMVLATVLAGQAILGWQNDLVDRHRDAADGRDDKPIGQGLLAPGDATFAMACAALAVVPLAVSHGVWAGLSYLGSLVIGLIGNVFLRNGWLSWLTWAASYGLYPAFLAYGGWAGEGRTRPPEFSVPVLAALLGVCVHVLVSLPGLVRDHEHGVRHLPLRLGLRIGAARLLWATILVTALVLAGLLATGAQVGLRQ